MGEFRDILMVGGFLISLFGLWYKLRKDIDDKISDSVKAVRNELNEVKKDTQGMQTTFITRHEHDRDINEIKIEVRSFRDEVRKDLRDLGNNISTRIDLVLQKMIEVRHP